MTPPRAEEVSRQPSGHPGVGAPVAHPRAVPALVFGVLGTAPCLAFFAPVALWLGRTALSEIDRSHGQWGGRGLAMAGYVLGVIGTLLVLLFAGWLAMLWVMRG
ncbi:DUF4190 domain-containing protein [Nocardioides ferulae]|uniref:DUF4190 domain-containing protein n=1 Tax=Nocardioides ferulae TaxID=2340821 RepID=UPI000EAD01C3|nr:DUF4190 domain-containing protein [Nocardioides ferulae]